MKTTSTISFVLLVAVSAAFCYTVQVNPLDLQINTVKIPSFGAYSSLSLKKAIELPVQPGEPQLPGLTVSLTIPTGMEIDSIQVDYCKPENLSGYYLVFPQQPPMIVDDIKPEFTPPNPKIYSSIRQFPGDLVWSFSSNNVSGYQMGSITFAPVQYIPLTGQLIFYSEIDFSVTYRAQRITARYPKERLRWVDDLVRVAVKANVINPDEITSPNTRLIESNEKTVTYPYLILTTEYLEQTANDLAYWKTKKGLNTKVETIEDILNDYSGVDDPDKIRNCIIDYYENYSTIYVLIIDSEPNSSGNLPMRSVCNPHKGFGEPEDQRPTIPSDNYYACLDGDWNADNDGDFGEYEPDNVDEVDFGYDVFLGRLSPVDSDELAIVNNKIGCYEGTELSNEINPYDYQNIAILAGAWLDVGYDLGYRVMQPISDDYMTSAFWDKTELWDSTFHSDGAGDVFNPTSFVSNINSGAGVIAHGSHCGQNWLGTNYAISYPYSRAKVENSYILDFDNSPRYTGIFYTLGCNSSDPEHNTNCAKCFLTASEGGGVGYIGNTQEGYCSPSEYYEKEFFNQLCINDIQGNGRTLAFHKETFSNQVSNIYYRFVYYELYLMGDPDIWVPNDTIEALSVTYDNSISTGTQDYSVNVQRDSLDLEGAMVCIWKGEEVYASGKTDSSGDITFSDIDPTASGTMYLTVTAANSETFEANVTVGSKAEIRLLSFNTKRNAKGTQLSWLVKSSFPVEGFNLYRRSIESNNISVDRVGKMKSQTEKVKKAGSGKSISNLPQGKWEKLNEKPITGKNPYRYLDKTAMGKEKYEYQLAVVNKKHSALLYLDENYLGTATVAEAAEVETFQLKIAPHPARANMQLLLTMPSAENSMKIILYDLSGREVSRWDNLYFGIGENQFSVPVEKLSNGVYQLKLIGTAINISKTIVIMH